MKILFSTLLLALVILAGCNSKWREEYPDMPVEFREEMETAIEENMEILSNDPKNDAAAFEIGFAYDQLGRLKKAETYYLKAVEINPNHDISWNNLLNLYEKVEDYDKASNAAEKLYALRPDNTETLQDVVRVFLEANEPENAILALEYFSRTRGADITPEEQQLVSDLYQQQLDYSAANDK